MAEAFNGFYNVVAKSDSTLSVGFSELKKIVESGTIAYVEFSESSEMKRDMITVINDGVEGLGGITYSVSSDVISWGD